VRAGGGWDSEIWASVLGRSGLVIGVLYIIWSAVVRGGNRSIAHAGDAPMHAPMRAVTTAMHPTRAHAYVACTLAQKESGRVFRLFTRPVAGQHALAHTRILSMRGDHRPTCQ